MRQLAMFAEQDGTARDRLSRRADPHATLAAPSVDSGGGHGAPMPCAGAHRAFHPVAAPDPREDDITVK